MDRVMNDAYGRRLGERMRTEHAQAIITRGLREADLAVTEVRSDRPSPAMSGSIQREDALLVGLLLRDFSRHEYWEDGRQAPVCDLRAGEIIFADLKRDPAVLLDKPYHSLHFYLPRAALPVGEQLSARGSGWACSGRRRDAKIATAHRAGTRLGGTPGLQ
jgi:AraC family transcriptional regulator